MATPDGPDVHLPFSLHTLLSSQQVLSQGVLGQGYMAQAPYSAFTAPDFDLNFRRQASFVWQKSSFCSDDEADDVFLSQRKLDS